MSWIPCPSSRRRPIRAALVLALAAAAASGAGAATDPFYTSRLSEGTAAFERQAWSEAAEELRIACFGMLDEPPTLGECLVRLALAQARAEDGEGFSHTFRQLVEAEELTQAYDLATVDEELRGQLEAEIRQRVPAAVLERTERFAHLVAERERDALSALPVRERRRELERRAREAPQDATWPAQIAWLEMTENRPRQALDAAETALAIDAAEPRARCARGWAAAELDRCAEAVADLAACPQRAESAFAVPLLRCAVAVEAWAEARRALADLPEAQRERDPVAGLARRVEAQAAEAAEGPPVEEAGSTAEEPGRTLEAPQRAAEEPSGHAERQAAAERLAEAERLFREATTSRQLDEVYRVAVDVAESEPSLTRAHYLAAEIAYRASRWQDAVRHFRAGGDPGDGEPQLLFYLAVSLYEAGEKEQAAAALRRCVDRLRQSPFVEGYRLKILGESG